MQVQNDQFNLGDELEMVILETQLDLAQTQDLKISKFESIVDEIVEANFIGLKEIEEF